jgi:dihydrofolate reductase
MTLVIGDISISVDGYVTGPDPDLEHGLGHDGEGIHAWVFGDDPVDRAILESSTSRSGAVIMGRNLFDIIDGPQGWGEEVGYGADQGGRPPFFVVTTTTPDSVRLAKSHDFTFVLDGLESAVEQARAAAGAKDVVVMGGAEVVRGCLEAGLLDELRLHVSPEVYGEGTPLFHGVGRHRLVQRAVEASSVCTHITYELRR